MHELIQRLSLAFLSLVLFSIWAYWEISYEINGTPRLYFLLYILSLLALSLILFNKSKRLFWIIIGLITIEFFLIALSYARFNSFEPPYLVPRLVAPRDEIFTYHPLLGATPTPNDTSRKSSTGAANPHKSIQVAHTSYGSRGYDPLGLEARYLVNVYGGSSTYDVGVDQGKTWPEVLNKILGEKFYVSSEGVPGYSSVEHLIQSLFYFDRAGKKPICSVYYVGWNDIRNSHIPTLERGYADYHLISQYNNLSIRKPPWKNSFSPLHALVGHALYSYDWVPMEVVYRDAALLEDAIDYRFLNYYFEHINKIVVINKNNGIQTVIVSQLLNPAKLTADKSYGWAPFIRDKDLWRVQEKVNQLLNSYADDRGISFIQPDNSLFVDSDFVDYGHFSSHGSKKFAALIGPHIKKSCTQNAKSGHLIMDPQPR